MKVIDAINKINREEKFRFRLLCDGDIYKYIGGSLYNETVGERAEWIIDNKWLNEEIEIIEQEHKIPEKFELHSWGDKNEYGAYVDSPFPTEEEFMNKINEILDYLEVQIER